ncbi:MAG: efflux RND transporter periplasmic adaptor subunit [Verrucomicrobiales bacterium]
MNENELENHEQARRVEIRAVFSFVLVLAVLALAGGITVLLIVNGAKAEHHELKKTVPLVAVQPIEKDTHTPLISTEGAVMSRREVRLAAEVSGRVLSISEKLVRGGRVEESEILARLDDSNYRAALARAQASLADAKLNLALEEAKGQQALKDWEKLGRGEASGLVLRKPQILAAEARIQSAVAEVEMAKKDLERTTIRAPFSGRIREAGVEVGAVVVPGSMVAEVYSDLDLEVRLPFSLLDFGFLQPEGTPRFTVAAEVGGEIIEWPAELVRVEGEVERATLSGFAIAKILMNADGELPPVGLFVRTEVEGRSVSDVVVVPRSALRGANTVWTELDRRLRIREVHVVRSTKEAVVVSGEFDEEERLVVTRLSTPVEGMEVNPVDESTAVEEQLEGQ